MRTRSLSVLSLAALAAGLAPAMAQSPGTRTLNETNDRLARQSEIRGVRHQQQFENNQIRMQMQRNEITRPAPIGPGIAPRR
ncbi:MULTISPECIES: hypothetical protein [Methylobacterium]|uniref:Secreted protein n=1 Tax=Methylobacterium bullatum TaxID=570505 RepID=A0AAV4Z8Q0_9HYPH|nr:MULTISPECIES: hypothetical protein [Methylobacterium]MBD8903255.1 hypothetical protein [Methylobacterium bullatum]TXN27700.1 hypothetical protein FV220_10295 [Methylobacterium sp. WL19]GJD40428.1 hypothetical protein OICFNHDK_2898 [Methylobacterium bullatum]